MGKIETASQREEKVRELSRRIGDICGKFYDTATDDQKKKLWLMLEDLENALIAYRKYDVPWDSKLIDVVENIQGRKFIAKGFSTDNSVMDKARELFAFVATGS